MLFGINDGVHFDLLEVALLQTVPVPDGFPYRLFAATLLNSIMTDASSNRLVVAVQLMVAIDRYERTFGNSIGRL